MDTMSQLPIEEYLMFIWKLGIYHRPAQRQEPITSEPA